MDIKETKEALMEEVVKKAMVEIDQKYITMEQFQKAIEEVKKNPIMNFDKKDELADEIKFWKEVSMKTAGDIDTASNAATIIPTAIADKIYEKLYQENYLRRICTVYPGKKGTVPVEGTALTATRVADGTAPNSGTPGTAKYSAVSYDSYELAADCQMSNKVIENATPGVLNYIYSHMAKQFSNTELAEFITGDNSTEWQGLDVGVTGSVLTMQTAQTGHTAITSIDYDDIVTVFYALAQQYRNNAAWIVNATTLAAIRKIADLNGRPIFTPTDPTIFGKPVFENSNMSTSGTTNGVIYFGDFSQYFIFDDKTVKITASKEGRTLVAARATYIIGTVENDGKIVNADGITGLKLAAA